MKQCASCAREIPDSATLCDSCQQWAVGVGNVTPSAASAPSRESVDPEPLHSTPSTGSATPEAIASAPLHPAPPVPTSAAKRPSPVIIYGGIAAAALLVVGLMARGGRGGTEATSLTAGPGGSPAPASVRPGAAAPATSSYTQTWSGANSAYWVGNRRKSAAFELPAERTVSVWTRSVRPTLVVRCMAQSTQVFVVTESPMKIEAQTQDHTVTYSIDGEAAVTERWPDSDEHDALFAPNGAAFAQRLLHARTFRFGFTPHNVPPVATDFNVAGLAALIEPVSKECGWKK